jgi:hypothetical protein
MEDTTITFSGEVGHYCVVRITPAIRWLVDNKGQMTLQQASRCQSCGAVTWNDVEKVREGK